LAPKSGIQRDFQFKTVSVWAPRSTSLAISGVLGSVGPSLQVILSIPFKKYRKLLGEYGKDYDYLELDGADHFSNTLFYRHQIALYEAMIDYLKNKCGPGGL
jgi:hypothetical protein